MVEIGLPIFNRSKTGMELLPTTEPIIEQLRIISRKHPLAEKLSISLADIDKADYVLSADKQQGAIRHYEPAAPSIVTPQKNNVNISI